MLSRILFVLFPPSSVRALRHRAYRRWAGADAVSLLGSWAQTIALSWVVLELTGSATALGATIALQSLPLLVLGPWGGALADRLPLRRLLAGTQLAQALLALLLAAVTLTGTATLPVLMGVAVAQGLVQVLDGPAHGLFGQQLVPVEDLANAAALGSVTSSAGRVLGMALAGVGVGTLGAPALFAANAVSFAAVIAVVLTLPNTQLHPLERAAGADASVRAGLRYALGRRELLVLLGLVLVCSSLGRNFSVMTAALVTGPLGGNSSAFAACNTFFAVGALLGGLIAARLRTLALRAILVSAAMAAAGQVLAAGSPGLPVLYALMLPVAAACVVLDTAVGSHLVLSTPAQLRGRVLALRGVVSAGSAAVGAPLLGAGADLLGARSTMALAGVVVLSCVGAAALAFSKAGRVRAPLARAFSARVVAKHGVSPVSTLT
jgi:MFS family permease